MTVEFPAYGQERAANELRESGSIISGGGVRSVWMRHDLENFKKPLKALEEKVANDNIILTDQQLAALKKSRSKKKLMVRLRPSILAILVHKIPIMLII